MEGGISLIFIQPNGTNATFLEAFAPLYAITNLTGVSAIIGNFDLPSWTEYGNYFLRDPNVATNVQDASRLLTPEVLTNKGDELVDLIFDKKTGGFNYSMYFYIDSPTVVLGCTNG